MLVTSTCKSVCHINKLPGEHCSPPQKLGEQPLTLLPLFRHPWLGTLMSLAEMAETMWCIYAG